MTGQPEPTDIVWYNPQNRIYHHPVPTQRCQTRIRKSAWIVPVPFVALPQSARGCWGCYPIGVGGH